MKSFFPTSTCLPVEGHIPCRAGMLDWGVGGATPGGIQGRALKPGRLNKQAINRRANQKL